MFCCLSREYVGRVLVGLFVGGLLLCGGSCAGQYAEFCSREYSSNDSWLGLLHGELKGYRIEAHFFRASNYELCIVDEGDGKPMYGNLEIAMRRNSCVAGVNGGYFAAGPARAPIGLLRHASRTVAPLAIGGFTVVGILYDTEKKFLWNVAARFAFLRSACAKPFRAGHF